MLFTEVTINEKSYKARLGAQQQVLVERKLGKTILSLFATVDETSLPSLEDLLTIFCYSLQKYQHSITIEDTYDLYDEYVDEGKSYVEFFQLVMRILQDSGIIRVEDEPEEEEVKN